MADQKKNISSEEWLEAMRIIAEKQMSQLSFDTTIEATIVDATKASDGVYTVSTGEANFLAYCPDTEYKEDDVVMVTIPQGNYDYQKMIIGRKINTKIDRPLTYHSPFEQIIDISNNLLSTTDVIELYANDVNNQWDISITDVLPLTQEDGKLKLIGTINNIDIEYSDLTRLGIKADFRTSLKTAVYGNYGLVAVITFVNKDLTENNTFSTPYIFDSSQFFGDIYNFNIYQTQEMVFDISGFAGYPIQSISLYAYQRNNFVNFNNEYIHGQKNCSFNDNLFNSTQPDIFIKNPYICVGIDKDSFTGDTVKIITKDSLYYPDIQEQGEKIINKILPMQNNSLQILLRKIAFNWLFQLQTQDINVAQEDIKLQLLYIGKARIHIPQAIAIIQQKYPDINNLIENEDFDITHITFLEQIFYGKENIENDESIIGLKNLKYSKDIHLQWIHQDDNTNIITKINLDQIPLNYEIRWYHYKIGAPSPDKFIGAHWERIYGCNITSTTNEDHCITNCYESYIKELNYINNNYTDDLNYRLRQELYQKYFNRTFKNTNEETNDLPNYVNELPHDDYTNHIAITFYPNTDKATEQLKVIIIKKTFSETNREIEEKIAESNIFTLTNRDDTIKVKISMMDVNALSIRYDDDEKGNYYLYNEAYEFQNSNNRKTRTLTAVFDENVNNIYEKAVLTTPYDFLEWEFPSENSMIIPGYIENNEFKKLQVPTENATGTKWLVVKEFDDYVIYYYKIPNTSTPGVWKYQLKNMSSNALITIPYQIESTLNFKKNKNTVYLTVKKAGSSHIASINMEFGIAGTSGSKYKIVVDWDTEPYAFDINKGSLAGTIRLLEDGNEIELDNDLSYQIEWSYKKTSFNLMNFINEIQNLSNSNNKISTTAYQILIIQNSELASLFEEDGNNYKYIGNTEESLTTIKTTFYTSETTDKYYPIIINDNSKLQPLTIKDLDNKIGLGDNQEQIYGEGINKFLYPKYYVDDINTNQTLFHYDILEKKYMRHHQGNDKYQIDNSIVYRLDQLKTIIYKPFSTVISSNSEYEKEGEKIPPGCVVFYNNGDSADYNYSSIHRAFIKNNGNFIIDPWDEYQPNETYYYPVYENFNYNNINPLQIIISGNNHEQFTIEWVGKEETIDDNIKYASKPDIDNDMYILRIKLKFGDIMLKEEFPIPLVQSDQNNDFIIESVEGPTTVRYSTNGTLMFEPEKYIVKIQVPNNGTLITRTIKGNQLNGGGHWELIYSREYLRGKETQYGLPLIETNNNITMLKDGSLIPYAFYLKNPEVYGVKFVNDGIISNDITAIWSSPISVVQNNYPSATINEWDGKNIEINNDKSIIMAHSFLAGRKNEENDFTGVIIGDWSQDIADEILTSQTGIFGMQEGALTYALKEDGTAFFGREGQGRIYLDGTKAQIYSSTWIYPEYSTESDIHQYQYQKQGMMLDIDDGIFKIISNQYEKGFNFIVDSKQPNFLIKYNDYKDLETKTPYEKILFSTKITYIIDSEKLYKIENNRKTEVQSGNAILTYSLTIYDYQLRINKTSSNELEVVKYRFSNTNNNWTELNYDNPITKSKDIETRDNIIQIRFNSDKKKVTVTQKAFSIKYFNKFQISLDSPYMSIGPSEKEICYYSGYGYYDKSGARNIYQPGDNIKWANDIIRINDHGGWLVSSNYMPTLCAWLTDSSSIYYKNNPLTIHPDNMATNEYHCWGADVKTPFTGLVIDLTHGKIVLGNDSEIKGYGTGRFYEPTGGYLYKERVFHISNGLNNDTNSAGMLVSTSNSEFNDSGYFILAQTIAQLDSVDPSSETLGVEDYTTIFGVYWDGSVYSKAYNLVSSRRFKKNIVSLNHSKLIYQLKPVSFQYKDSEKINYGFIAEDVYKILPEVVLIDNKNPKEVCGLNYNSIFTLAVAEIQQLRKELDVLKQQVIKEE